MMPFSTSLHTRSNDTAILGQCLILEQTSRGEDDTLLWAMSISRWMWIIKLTNANIDIAKRKWLCDDHWTINEWRWRWFKTANDDSVTATGRHTSIVTMTMRQQSFTTSSKNWNQQPCERKVQTNIATMNEQWQWKVSNGYIDTWKLETMKPILGKTWQWCNDASENKLVDKLLCDYRNAMNAIIRWIEAQPTTPFIVEPMTSGKFSMVTPQGKYSCMVGNRLYDMVHDELEWHNLARGDWIMSYVT
jgi:hypothetical protein